MTKTTKAEIEELRDRMKMAIKPGETPYVPLSPYFIKDICCFALKAIEALEYYQGIKTVCTHDDSSWCDHCPDGGKRARLVLTMLGGEK